MSTVNIDKMWSGRGSDFKIIWHFSQASIKVLPKHIHYYNTTKVNEDAIIQSIKEGPLHRREHKIQWGLGHAQSSYRVEVGIGPEGVVGWFFLLFAFLTAYSGSELAQFDSVVFVGLALKGFTLACCLWCGSFNKTILQKSKGLSQPVFNEIN